MEVVLKVVFVVEPSKLELNGSSSVKAPWSHFHCPVWVKLVLPVIRKTTCSVNPAALTVGMDCVMVMLVEPVKL